MLVTPHLLNAVVQLHFNSTELLRLWCLDGAAERNLAASPEERRRCILLRWLRSQARFHLFAGATVSVWIRAWKHGWYRIFQGEPRCEKSVWDVHARQARRIRVADYVCAVRVCFSSISAVFVFVLIVGHELTRGKHEDSLKHSSDVGVWVY